MNRYNETRYRRDPLWDELALLPAQLARPPLFDPAEAELSVSIGKRALVPMRLELPLIISHMGYGFVSAETKCAMARAATSIGTAIGGGGGGVLSSELELSSAYIFEYTPGLYGLTPEVLERCAAVEIKLGRSDLGPLGETLPAGLPPEVYSMRMADPNEPYTAPGRFGEINSVSDLRVTVEGLREGSGGKPVGIKLAAGRIEADLDVAIEAGADFVTVDGRSTVGGRLGGPCLPTAQAVARARAHLDGRGSDIDIIAAGGMRTPADFAKALALGATAAASASAVLEAVGADENGDIAEPPEKAALRLEAWMRDVRAAFYEICAFTGHGSVGALSRDDLYMAAPAEKIL